jgi:uncharacterized membrane protein affecting hemolysin expression
LAKFSLKRRVMLAAALAVALVLLTDAVLRHIEMEGDGRRSLAERAALLASIQGDALSIAMWNLDEDQVRTALDALAADPDFVSAAVTKPAELSGSAYPAIRVWQGKAARRLSMWSTISAI